MNLEAVKKELENNSQYKESGISFDEVTVIQDGEYLQKAKSGFNLHVALVNADGTVAFYADNTELEKMEIHK